jgi:hypothetical protein
MGIMTALKQYKTNRGEVNYDLVLSIPYSNRLPQMAEKDFAGIIGILSAALTLAFESLNLKRPMTDVQVVDLAETILESSTEDYLSMEDVMLFLQKFIRGEYGSMYESMDIPKFMLAFESYRQKRHEAYLQIQENRHLSYKGIGGGDKAVKSDLEERFYSLGNQLSEMKTKLREARQENQKLKDIDKF